MQNYPICMIGGGLDSMIGSTHRLGARESGYFRLVAGCFSKDHHKSLELAQLLRLQPQRCYQDWKEMISTEMKNHKGARIVIIATPDPQHYEQALFALEHNMHVICDKPVTIKASEALTLRNLAKHNKLLFGVTYTHNGNPAFIRLKEIISKQELGHIRMLRGHLFAPWAISFVEDMPEAPMHKQSWRLQKEYGEAGAISDIGSHVYQYMHNISGLKPTSLVADLQHMVAKRTSDDTAQVLFSYKDYKQNLGVTGVMSISLAMTTSTEQMAIEILCDNGGARVFIDVKDHKSVLVVSHNNTFIKEKYLGNNSRISEYLNVGVSLDSVDMFSYLYKQYGKTLSENKETDFESYPSIQHGYEGMVFIENALKSARNHAWTPMLFE